MDTKLVNRFTANLAQITETELAISKAIAREQRKLSRLQAKDRLLREEIKAAMIASNRSTYSNDILTITYIAPTKRTIVDSKRLKADHPELWQLYSKIVNVSDSIRINIGI